MPATASTARVLVAGGGPAALETALALREPGDGRRQVVLVAPGRHLTLRTLENGRPRAVRVALSLLAEHTGMEHVRDAVAAVDLPAGRVHTQDGLELAYDALVLAVGARAVPAVPGALTYRDPRDVGRLNEALERIARNGHRPRVVFAVPPGVTGSRPLYELAVHTATRLSGDGVDAELSVVTPETRMPHQELGDALASARVTVQGGLVPTFVEDGRLWAGPPGGVPADLVVALPHRAGPALPGVPADAAGFALVDADGLIEGTDDAYAIGSMATREAGARAGGGAAQAAAVAQRLAGVPPVPPPTGSWPRLQPYVIAHGRDVTSLG
jgi:sulfide:quinone oxidoreductase